MEKIEFNASNLERVRVALVSNLLEPSPAKPAFADEGYNGLKLRTSRNSLTFVAQVYEMRRGERQSRYLSIAKLPTSDPVTPERVDEIRREFVKLRDAAAAGNTGERIDDAKAKKQGEATLSEMAEAYFALPAALELKTFPNRRRTIRKLLAMPYQGSPEERKDGINARTSYGELTLAQISTEAATNLYLAMGSIKSRTHNRTAINSMFSALRDANISLPARNPFRDVPKFKTRKRGDPSPRVHRYFSPASLRKWVAAIESLFANDEITSAERDYLYFLALAPRRRGKEVLGITWREVSLVRELISIPLGRTKNNRSFEQPISPPLLAILKRRQREFDALPDEHPAKIAGLVFWNRKGAALGNPARLAAKIDVKMHGLNVKPGKVRRAPKGVEPWLYHDTRRTAMRYMEDGFRDWLPGYHDKLMLGHSLVDSSSATAAYTNPKMRTLKRTLFDYWAKLLATILFTDAEEYPLPDQKSGAEESLQALVEREGQEHLRRLCAMLA